MFEIIASVIAFFYDLTSSYAAAIILLTVTIRLLLFPLTAKQTRSMQNMSKVQPQIKAIQAEHADDRQKMNEEVMKFYKENKINPAAGCLPLLLQAPILFGLYRVINGLTRTTELSGLMIQVQHPKYLSVDKKLYRSLVDAAGEMRSIGIDLAQSAQSVSGTFAHRLPYVILVVLVGLTGYLQQIIMTKQQGPATTAQAAQMQKVMKYMPVMFAFISFNIQAAIVLYWIVGNIWMIFQSQALRKLSPAPVIPDAVGAPAISAAKAAISASESKSSGSKSTGSKPGSTKATGGTKAADGTKTVSVRSKASSSKPIVANVGQSSNGKAALSAAQKQGSSSAKAAVATASSAAKKSAGKAGQQTKRK